MALNQERPDSDGIPIGRISIMPIRKSMAIIAALCILTLPVASFGKGTPAKKGGGKSAFSCTPLDLSLERLPAGYQGQNIIGLSLSLLRETKTLEKGEFEKQADHEARLAKVVTAPLPAGLNCGEKLDRNSLFAFIAFDGVTQRYDPETGTMDIYIPGFTITNNTVDHAMIAIEEGREKPRYFGDSALAFKSKQVSENLGTYIGHNAFGAKKQIGTFRDTIFTIATPGSISIREVLSEEKDEKRYGNNLSFSIPMPVAKAKSAKEDGRILFIGKLLFPYLGLDDRRSAPTFDSPIDITETTYSIAFDLQQIWYYNLKSGEIYKKIDTHIPSVQQEDLKPQGDPTEKE